MWTWLLKLLGGFLPIGTKPFPEWLGKVIWGIGMGVCAFFIMTNIGSCFKKPIPQPSQEITVGGAVYRIEPRFGCATVNMPKESK